MDYCNAAAVSARWHWCCLALRNSLTTSCGVVDGRHSSGRIPGRLGRSPDSQLFSAISRINHSTAQSATTAALSAGFPRVIPGKSRDVAPPERPKRPNEPLDNRTLVGSSVCAPSLWRWTEQVLATVSSVRGCRLLTACFWSPCTINLYSSRNRSNTKNTAIQDYKHKYKQNESSDQV